MKYFLFFSFFLFSNLVLSKKLYFDEMLSYEITTETSFSDNKKYQTFKVKGGVTFSSGVYAIKNCSGDRTLDGDELVELKSICKLKISDGEFIWTKVSGKKRYSEKGTGIFEIIDGSGVYKNLIGSQCKYALNIFDEIIFAKGVCNLTEEIFKSLNSK